MVIHTWTHNSDAKLAQGFQKYLSNVSQKMFFCTMENTKNRQVKNCKNRKYPVQKDEDFEHQYVKFYFTSNQIPELPFLFQK